MSQRIIGAPLEVARGDRHRYIAYNALTRRRFVVDRELLEIVLRLDGLATVDEHLRSLSETTMPHLASTDLFDLIREAQRAGLVATEDSIREALASKSARPPKSRISSVCWISRNRPEEVHSSIDSWTDSLSPSDRRPQLLVFDDSDQSPFQKPGTILMGRSSASGLIRHLTAEGIPERVAQFAFFGAGRAQYDGAYPAYGANRNRCLALTAGQMVLMLDDDVSCRFLRRSSASKTPVLSGHVDPTHVFYYVEEGEDFQDKEFEEVPAIDPLALHEAYLGQPLASVQQEHGIDLSTINRSLLKTLIGRQRRCRVTQPGHFGASGTRHRGRLLHLAGPIRARHNTDASFHRGLVGMRSRRWVDRPILSTGSAILSMIMAIDNTTPTPPFLPLGRGEEWIWSTIFQACDPMFIAYLPDCVHHRGAPGSGGGLVSPTEYRFSLTEGFRHLVALWSSSEADRANPLQALERLGSHLLESARLPWSDFVERITPLWIREAETTRDRIEDLLMLYGKKPTAWAKAAEDFLDSIELYLEAADFGVPFDLPTREESYLSGAADREGWPRGAFLQLVEDYGHLLQWWGEIWRLSADYNSQLRPID